MSMVSVIAALAVVAVQGLGGALWWLTLRRGYSSGVETIGMGLALGTISSTLVSLVLHTTPLGPVAWALPTVAAGVAWLIIRRRPIVSSPESDRIGPSTTEATSTVGEARAVVIGALVGLVPLILNWRRIPLGSVNDSSFLDIYFLQALSSGLARYGAGESILMTGGSIRYHWFAYAWVGDIDALAGLPAFAGLTRVLPLVALVGISAVAARWTSVLSTGKRFATWAPTLAVLLIVGGGYTGALYGSILNFDSPSQTLTTLWLLALLFATVIFIRAAQMWMLLPIAVLASASTGGKISHIAVGAGGMLLLTGVGFIARQRWVWRSVLVLVVSGSAALVTYVLVIRGAAVDRNLVEEVAVKASTWQGLDPLPGTWGVLAGTIAFILAAMARVAGIGWLVRTRAWWTDPSMLLALGGLGVGLTALLALRDGINETWFLLAASAAVSILSAVGVTAALEFLVDRVGRSTTLRVTVVIALVSLPALILTMNAYSEDVRPFAHWMAAWTPWLVALIGAASASIGVPRANRMSVLIAFAIVALVASSIVTRPTSWWTAQREVTTESDQVVPEAFTPPESPEPEANSGSSLTRAALATKLGQLAEPDDVVFSTDPRSALVPAYAGLRMYLAGDRYQFGLGDAGDAGQLRDRQAAIAEIITDPDRAAEILCPDSVDWLWWEGTVPDVLAPYVSVAGAHAAIIDFRDECGASSTS